MENGKWKKVAIIEAIVILIVVVFAAGFFFGKGDAKEANTTVASQEAVANNTIQETTSVGEQTTAATTQTQGTTEQESSSAAGQAFDVESADGLKVTFQQDQQWGDETMYYYSYTAIVENTGSAKIEEWALKCPVSEDFEVSSAWNATCEVIDGCLYITPVDFNKVLEPGAKVDSVGFIFSCKGEAVFEDVVIGTKAVDGNAGETNTEASNTQETSAVSDNKNNNETDKTESSSSVKGEDAMTDYRGKLSVDGTNLVDKDGNIVQLRGISTHGIAWYPDYVNYDSFKTLKDLGANTVRLAMYTGENGGYCAGGDQAKLKKMIEDGVKYATDLSMYVIIDWHILSDNNPNTYKNAAIAFFDEMSKKYADYDNVIYEICNEPNGGTSWSEVKSYAEEVIGVIRKNDADGIILVGTPTWSQDVDKAAADPIKADNIMYVLHFYAATHKDDLRNKMVTAIKGGLPIFISEFSICDASGNGGIDYDSANKWLEVINEYNVSYVGWNLSNKNETSAILKTSCTKTSGYTKDDLSDSGKWLVETFK